MIPSLPSRLSTVFLILIACLSGVSCSSDDDNPTQPNTVNWFPLSSNQIRYWSNTAFDSAGAIVDQSIWNDTTRGTRAYNGESYYLNGMFYNDHNPNHVCGTITRTSGVYSRDLDSTVEVLQFKLPPTVGATWNADYIPKSARWEAINQTITIEAGTFTNAAKAVWGPMDPPNDSSYVEFWIVPDWGWVQTKFYADYSVGAANDHVVNLAFHGRVNRLVH